ncbi:MAG: hypothetical protein ACFFDB_09210 [Promethearchaeota archaeon]
MNSRKTGILRPRCNNCGKRIYLKYSPYKNYLFSDPPLYCPNCGEQFSVEKTKNLVEHEELIYGISLIIVVIIIIVVFGVIIGR